MGQTLGNCLSLSVSGSGNLVNPVLMCLELNAAIKRSNLYTVNAFVIQHTNASDGSFTYTPQAFRVVETGTHLCANVSTPNTMFCPALLVDGWASKTSDVGSSECGALATLVEDVEKIQEEVKKGNYTYVERTVVDNAPVNNNNGNNNNGNNNNGNVNSPSPSSIFSNNNGNNLRQPNGGGGNSPAPGKDDLVEDLLSEGVTAVHSAALQICILCLGLFIGML